MAKKKPKASNGTGAESEFLPAAPMGVGGGGGGPETTGRFIIIFKDYAVGDPALIKSTLNQVAGLKDIATASDYQNSAFAASDLADSECVRFDRLGIVIVANLEAVSALARSASAADSPILAIEPEYVAYTSNFPATPGQAAPGHSALMAGGLQLDYLRGYRDAAAHLYDMLSGGGSGATAQELGADGGSAAAFQNNAQFTWGLQAVGAHTSRYSGMGVKVAVLDSGMDLSHPDFAGRPIISQSFVGGPVVNDVDGHGTHCVGTACGSLVSPTGRPRYGVAHGSLIYVGKVGAKQGLDPRTRIDAGNATAGVEWAIATGCRVVSMSFGIELLNAKVYQYETVIQRALDAGTLVIAAAGNNAKRSLGNFGFVESPANADAAMAVGALDSQLGVADFSARSSTMTGAGGIVNIAAPGVNVLSSWKDGGHNSISGTSMATPHVAGVAALWSEATGETGRNLWLRLVQMVRPLAADSRDVGAGLVQAPQ